MKQNQEASSGTLMSWQQGQPDKKWTDSSPHFLEFSQ